MHTGYSPAETLLLRGVTACVPHACLCTAQAQVYFPSEMYSALEDALIAFGEQHLGCRAISPIWMSYYVDGCVQELHCDSPHGPFAFVLSLTGGVGDAARGAGPGCPADEHACKGLERIAAFSVMPCAWGGAGGVGGRAA